MTSALDRHITIFSLLKFTFPSVLMMMCMAFYIMVDGFFIANFVGTNALSAVNIIYPAINVVFGLCVMLGSGGSAIIAKELGEKKDAIARKNFSLVIYIALALGVALTTIGLIFIEPILKFLGATELIYHYCYQYAFTIFIFLPMATLQIIFQYLFVTAGQPKLGLLLTVSAGVTNIILDYLFVVHLKMGIGGAALGTGIGFSIPAVAGLIYFSFFRRQSLYFVRPRPATVVLYRASVNGSSEMVTNLSGAVTTFLFNQMALKYIGENGVAAIAIILYAEFLLIATFLGYAAGVAPLFSYNYGSRNIPNLKKLFRHSIVFCLIFGVVIFIITNAFSGQMANVFANEDNPVFAIAKNGLELFAYSFFLIGINIFASALFTALSNGKVSAILSFIRTFLLLSTFIVLLPRALGIDGIWLALPCAEAVALLFSLFFFSKMRSKYHYY